MKTKLTLVLLAIAGGGLNLNAANLPAPLPDLMNQEQLAKWTSDQVATTSVTASSEATSNQFYTGKPFVAEAGGYVFKYRTYSPEMSRWTSADPSGFPDGVNNFIYSNNHASYCLDNDGLATLEGISGTITTIWNQSSNLGGYTNFTVTSVAGDTGVGFVIGGIGKLWALGSTGSTIITPNEQVIGTGTSLGYSPPAGSTTAGADGNVTVTALFTNTFGTDQNGNRDLTVTVQISLIGTLNELVDSGDSQTIWGGSGNPITEAITTDFILTGSLTYE